MAKRIAFAWVNYMYMFDNEDDAKRYCEQAKKKKYMIEIEPTKNADGRWYAQVCKPYKHYNGGW